MKFLICTILTLFTLHSFSQNVSLPFLENLFHQSFETANDKIIATGYSFTESYKIGSSNSTAYVYDDSKIKNQYASYGLTIEITENDSCNQILFQTASKQDYLNFKEQLKKGGYKFLKTSNEVNKIIFTYFNEAKNIYCEITQDLAKNVNNELTNRYLIRIV